MAALEIIESVWQKTAIKGKGFSDDPDAVLHMSTMWLLLNFVITEFSEASVVLFRTSSSILSCLKACLV